MLFAVTTIVIKKITLILESGEKLNVKYSIYVSKIQILVIIWCCNLIILYMLCDYYFAMCLNYI